MKELSLPHLSPLRFAQNIFSLDDTKARVYLNFQQLPSLGMMIESSAQASAAFSDENAKGGFLVSLKNVKLLSKAKSMSLEVSLTKEADFGSMSSFFFVVYEGTKELVNGSFVIAKS